MFIKVNNFDDVAKDTLDEWIYFLKNSEIKKEFSAKGLQEAKEKMNVDNLEGGDKYDYEAFIKEQRIKNHTRELSLLFNLLPQFLILPNPKLSSNYNRFLPMCPIF